MIGWKRWMSPFPLSNQGGKSAVEALDHMRGINFSDPVTVGTIPRWTILQQYVGRGIGNYFSLPGVDALALGVGDAAKRTLTLLWNSEPVSALRTTASDFVYPEEVNVPGAGGGKQFYIPDKAAFKKP